MEAEIVVPYFTRGISIVENCVKRTKKYTSVSNRRQWGRNKAIFALLWALDDCPLLTFQEGENLQICIKSWWMCNKNAVVCKNGYWRFSWSKHGRKFDQLEYKFAFLWGYHEDLYSAHIRNALCIILITGYFHIRQ